MLRLPAFEYLAPRTIAEAVHVFADAGPETMLVAGGTDLYPNMKRRQFEPRTLVGLRAIPELRGVRGNGAHGLSHRRGHHPDVRGQPPGGRAALRGGRHRGGLGVVAPAQEHGNRRRESLRGYAVQLLQPDSPVAEGHRLLHEEGRRHLPGGARQSTLLGGVLVRHGARLLESGRSGAPGGPAGRADRSAADALPGRWHRPISPSAPTRS